MFYPFHAVGRVSILCFGLMVLLVAPLSAKPFYEKIYLGMETRAFNAFLKGPGISEQDRPKVLTSYGLVELDTEVKKKYIPLNKEGWKGMKVTFQNNQIREMILQGGVWLEKEQVQRTFSDMLRLCGTKIKGDHFRSLNRKGYRVVWPHQNYRVVMNLVYNAEGACLLNIRKHFRHKKEEVKQYPHSENVLLALAPHLGEELNQLNSLSLSK